MATLTGAFFTTGNSDFSGIPGLSGMGITISGTASPQGIPGALSIENGMMVAETNDNQPKTGGAYRTEIYFDAVPDGETWTTWDFMLPDGPWAEWQGDVTMGQFHDHEDAGDPVGRQPPIMLQFRDGVYQVVWPRDPLPPDCMAARQVGVLTLEYNRWYSVAVHINWTIDPIVGFREVFVDRVPVYREFNCATMYDDVNNPYLKLGVYITNDGFLAGYKKAYFKNLKFWTGTGSYEDIIGGVPICPFIPPVK